MRVHVLTTTSPGGVSQFEDYESDVRVFDNEDNAVAAGNEWLAEYVDSERKLEHVAFGKWYAECQDAGWIVSVHEVTVE